MTAPGSPLTRTPGLAEVLGEAHATVLNLPRLEEQQVPYVFEGTAFEIWTRIDGTLTEGEIVAELASAYAVAADEIAPQVREFLAHLSELGLIAQDATTMG